MNMKGKTMLNQQTIEKLAVLKLNGMADNFTLQLQRKARSWINHHHQPVAHRKLA